MEKIFERYAGLLTPMLIMFTAGFTVIIMVVGRSIIIPIVIALFIWYFITSLAEALHRRQIFGLSLPRWLALVIVFVGFILVISWVVTVVYFEVLDFLGQMPRYQQNLTSHLEAIPSQFWQVLALSNSADVAFIANDLFDAGFAYASNYASTFAAGLAIFLTQALLITVYVIFLLVEESIFQFKIEHMFSNPEQRAEVQSVLRSIRRNIRRYISVKTYISLLVGTACYIIMWFFGLEHAIVWAFMIFLLNYIPNVGSTIAVVFPVFTSVLQFSDWSVIAALFACLVTIQMFIGYWVEPRWMGNRLNLSPLVVLVSLTVFGPIWGVPGLFLSVPLTVVLMIILAHIQTTRPIAILLSGNGDVSGFAQTSLED